MPASTGPHPVGTERNAWWGVSTASYQNEDRGVREGSPLYFQTDWDIFESQGHAPLRGEQGAHLWSDFDEYLRTLKLLGVNHFRFSIEWARVEPRPGVINQAAIAGYVSMARKLRLAGIEPIVTLWHFTFPSWLYHTGRLSQSDLLDPTILPEWEAYVSRMVRALKPYVKVYVPENEPNASLTLGYVGGLWPPDFTLGLGQYKKAMDVSVTMFRNAAAIIRREEPGALVMSIHAIPHWRKNWLQDPADTVYNAMLHLNFDHLDRVYDTCDLIGVNYYFVQDASLFRFLNRIQGEKGMKYNQLGWEIDPEGLYDVLGTVYARYHKPVIVTENGLATLSEEKKIRYLRQHINQMRRAAADGIDVRGYFAWSLVDNYEWQEGWNANFGLSYLDPRNGRLVLEPSGLWFRDFIRNHPDIARPRSW